MSVVNGFRFDPAQLPYRELTLDFEIKRPPNIPEAPGSYAVLHTDDGLGDLLQREYGRSGLVLKLIPVASGLHPGMAKWDGVPLGMAGLIQNLLAVDGLAPRVYGLARVNGTHAAQITDYVPEGRHLPRTAELMTAFKLWGVKTRKNWDVSGVRGNWRDGMFVDFSGLYLPDEVVADIADHIRNRAMTKKGVSADGAYQAVHELKIPGDRHSGRRLPRVASARAARSNVLDIGCNLGHFLRLADRVGARRVIGVDRGETARLCHLINILLGYWQIDVVDAKMPRDQDRLPSLNYALVICLSAVKYLGDQAIPWLVSLAPTLWLEGHGDIAASHYLPSLCREYRNVERLPDILDNKRRAQFFCTNGAA